MRDRIARGIVKRRIWILAAMLILCAWSGSCIGKTRINYDLNRYLSDDTMTKRALARMEEEFGSSDQMRLMFAGQSPEDMETIVSDLNALDPVLLAEYDREKDVVWEGQTRQLVTLSLSDCDASALTEELRAMFPQAGVRRFKSQVASICAKDNNRYNTSLLKMMHLSYKWTSGER